MLSPLFIQLFGRDVTDCLSRAGFESTDAIATSGPEAIAEQAGIAVSLARRIVAVAVEMRATSFEPEVEEQEAAPPGISIEESEEIETPAPGEAPVSADAAPLDPDPGQSERTDRHIRRPLRRPQSALLDPDHTPVADESASTSPPASTPEGPASVERTVEPPGEIEAFIDDANLISWMGFASRAGRRAPASVAVSDDILDTSPRTKRGDPPGQPAGDRPEKTEPVGSKTDGAEIVRTRTAKTDTPVKESAKARPGGAPGAKTTSRLESPQDSLWSFGVWREPKDGQQTGNSVKPSLENPRAAKRGRSKPVPAQEPRRRRRHDGH